MRKHPEIGAEIIGDHSSVLLKMARDIALCHHEKWNVKVFLKVLPDILEIKIQYEEPVK